MKKTILLILLFCGFIFMNETKAQNIKFGVRAGYNSAKWRGESLTVVSELTNTSDAFSVSSKGGYYIGGYTQIALTDKLLFEPGIGFSQKGVKFSLSYPGENILKWIGVRADVVDYANYIDLPVHLKYQITDKFYIYGGPQVSYLISNKVEGRAGIFGVSFGRKIDFDRAFNKWDVSMTGGVGLNLSPKLNVQAGYDYGFTKLDNTINAEIYNRVVKVGVGFTF